MSVSLNYVLLQCFYWCMYAFPWSFTVLYLSHCGISSTYIGLITGISSVLSIFLQPYMSSIINKYKKINYKNVLLFSIVIFIVFGFVMLFEKTPHITALSFLIVCTLSASVPSLISTVCMEYINNGINVNFGLARGLGSISYAIFVFIMGKAVSMTNVDILVPVYIFFGIVLFIVIAIMKMPPKRSENFPKSMSFAEFYSNNKGFIVFLISSVALFTSHFMINGFLINKITSVGGGSYDLGVSLFISAGIELPVMAYIVLIIKKTGIKNLMALCSIFFVLKTAVIFSADSITAVYISQFMQFGAFAVYTPASVYFVNMTLDEKYRATGQALVGAATLGIGSALGNALGGRLLDLYGIDIMLAAALVFAFVGSTIMLLQRISDKNYLFCKFTIRKH